MSCFMLLKSWALMLVIIGVGERAHLQRLVHQSAALKQGASENDVLRVVGEPALKWDANVGLARFLFGERPAQWIYGTRTDLQAIVIPELPFPNPIPIRLRLFSTYDDDLIIEWTPERKISKVKRPKIDVPKDAEAILDSVFFITDIASMFMARKAN